MVEYLQSLLEEPWRPASLAALVAWLIFYAGFSELDPNDPEPHYSLGVIDWLRAISLGWKLARGWACVRMTT